VTVSIIFSGETYEITQLENTVAKVLLKYKEKGLGEMNTPNPCYGLLKRTQRCRLKKPTTFLIVEKDAI
jgi:hypothetical protein